MTNPTHLTDFEQLVLLSVLRLGDEVYGAAIRDDLEETAGRSAAIATIYVALSRMEKRGWVRSWKSDPTPVRGGKSKRYYALEPAGLQALRDNKAMLERMWSEVRTALEAGGS